MLKKQRLRFLFKRVLFLIVISLTVSCSDNDGNRTPILSDEIELVRQVLVRVHGYDVRGVFHVVQRYLEGGGRKTGSSPDSIFV